MDESPETSELLTFVRTVEAGSISRAARELQLPRPTVGRRLGRLEEKLGVRLLRRTTRAMALTDAGEAFFSQARAVLAAVRDAEASVRRGDGAVRGLLRVTTPPLQGTGFGAMLAAFCAKHPEVRVEHDASTRHFDLVAGTFDVAIRAGLELPPGLVARTLAKTRLVAVASPAYLAARGTPRRVVELSRHRCLVGFALGEHPATHWPLLRGGRVRVESAMASNDLATLQAMARDGLGITLLPLTMAYDELASGALRAVLPERLGAESRVAAVWVDREFVPPAVRAFVDAVVEWVKSDPVLSRPMPRCEGHPAKGAARARSTNGGAGRLVRSKRETVTKG